MRHYETTYILRPNLGEDQFTEIIKREAIQNIQKKKVFGTPRHRLKKFPRVTRLPRFMQKAILVYMIL